MADGAVVAAAAAGAGPQNEVHSRHDQIAILDFGSQYSHLIARRIRELNVYCEMHSCLVEASVLAERPLKGIILSGSPYSVYEDGSPHIKPDLLALAEERNLPILGICYGYQELTNHLGGTVETADKHEYGNAALNRCDDYPGKGTDMDILKDVPADSVVWMSHGDKTTKMADCFVPTAFTANCEYAAVVHREKPIYGLQFHPEVAHTQAGKQLIEAFVCGVCGASRDWTMASFVDEAVESIREAVGPTGRVIGAVSGGVDSTVAAVLMNRAIGDRFHAVLVDNGLLRVNEAERVVERLRDECGVNLAVVDATEQFLTNLEGASDPERKRKIIGHTFIEVFEAEAQKMGKVDFLLQGTLYPDVIESVSFKGPSATIKSHHNVGGLLEDMRLRLIEPLRELFKDEVRALGLAMGLPESSVFRHPFPGPGLAIRILGAVTREGLRMARQADDIFMTELHASGHYTKIGQAFAVLLPCKSVGVMGDGRTYEQVVALRAAATTDFMTADWYHMPYDVLGRVSTRIINEVRGVNRVVYDISSKPPATIEWE